MNEKAFAAFLKKKGKKADVIERNIRTVNNVADFMKREFHKQFGDISPDDIKQYVAALEAPEKIAAFEPDELHAFFVKFMKESGWHGIALNLKDLVGNVASARKLKKVVEE